jgi:hypothetical protein
LSLYTAHRGDKEHLRYLYEADSFDLEQACLDEGRNNALWAYCYWLWRRGDCLPNAAECRRLVRRCNKATGYLNIDGEPERFTLYEAQETVKQVGGYSRSLGIAPLVRRLRKGGKGWTRDMEALAGAFARLSEETASCEFSASYRQLSRMSGVSVKKMKVVCEQLQAKRRVWKVGECKPYGTNVRGTSIWSIRPPRPRQNIDEKKPPEYKPRSLRWHWENPEDRGVVTPWLFARRVAREAKLYEAARRANVPNMTNSPNSTNSHDQERGLNPHTGPPIGPNGIPEAFLSPSTDHQTTLLPAGRL